MFANGLELGSVRSTPISQSFLVKCLWEYNIRKTWKCMVSNKLNFSPATSKRRKARKIQLVAKIMHLQVVLILFLIDLYIQSLRARYTCMT